MMLRLDTAQYISWDSIKNKEQSLHKSQMVTRPDGPKTSYFLRRIKLIAQPLQYLEGYQKQYGDIFAVGTASAPIVYLGHPTALQTVFATPANHFQSGGGAQLLRFLLGEFSVIVTDGDRHLRQRRLLMPTFHSDRLKGYQQTIVDITRQLISQWQVGTPFRARPVMQDITLRVILSVVFGLDQGSRYEELRRLLSAMMETLGSPLSASLVFFPILQRDWGDWSPWGRFLRLKQQVDQIIYAEIQERQTRGDRTCTDVLSMLLSASDENGQSMTSEEIRDELITLLVAGHETTASALCWALYWVHTLPDVKTTLRTELADLGNPAPPEAIARLPYLTAVCQETLRLYPIALTTGARRLKVPLEVMGYHLETGTVLFPCIYLVHHHPDLYPDSKRFLPNRFLQRQFAPHEYLPFGGGHRYCIGAALAMMELKLVLATLLQEWELEKASDRPIEPVRRGVTLAPPAHLAFIPRARLQS